jgi:hypothetical protein
MRRPGGGKSKLTDAQLIAAAEDSDDDGAGRATKTTTPQDELSNVLYVG